MGDGAGRRSGEGIAEDRASAGRGGDAGHPQPGTLASLGSPTFLRQLESLTLVSRRRIATQSQGDRRSPFRGNSLQLVDFRAYTPGDDLRQVDWNAYGRTNQLYVRLYEDERILTVHLLLDVSKSMDWGTPNKRQAVLGLAGALACVALSGYDRLQIGFLGERLIGQAGPFWGEHKRAAALTALAAAPSANQTNFPTSLSSYLDRLRQPGLLILITDLLSPTAEDGLRRLASARHEAVVLHLLSPQELDPEPAEDVQLIDRETGQSIEVNLDLATLARYRERLAAWCEHLGQLCRERNGRYVRLSSGDNLETSVIRTLRANGVLK
jgi:uncharacterized protein (DUF58 family)